MIPKKEYPNITDRTLFELDQLFEATTPELLGKNLHLLLSFYLRESPHLEGQRHRRMIDDVCFLIQFLHNIQ